MSFINCYSFSLSVLFDASGSRVRRTWICLPKQTWLIGAWFLMRLNWQSKTYKSSCQDYKKSLFSSRRATRRWKLFAIQMFAVFLFFVCVWPSIKLFYSLCHHMPLIIVCLLSFPVSLFTGPAHGSHPAERCGECASRLRSSCKPRKRAGGDARAIWGTHPEKPQTNWAVVPYQGELIVCMDA